jgi:uncharacterized protein (UPF0264 family)
VSVTNEVEGLEAFKGGADILDIKNPVEGALGANFPWVIKRIRKIIPQSIEVSATIGDLPNLPGTSALAALGAMHSGANYIKAGIFGPKTATEAIYLIKNICKAVEGSGLKIKVVAAGYADYEKIGVINPMKLPEVAYKSGAHGILIDVKEKNGGKLFDFFDAPQLKNFVKISHKYGLTVALAGGLLKEDIAEVFRTGADIIGVRKAVCENGDRMHGKILRDLVKEFALEVRQCQKLTVDNCR